MHARTWSKGFCFSSRNSDSLAVSQHTGTLPESIQALTNLRQLTLKGNPTPISYTQVHLPFAHQGVDLVSLVFVLKSAVVTVLGCIVLDIV